MDPASTQEAAASPRTRSRCSACGKPFDRAADPLVPVRCNIRKFARETFHMWRCSACRCIHCWERVELARYYAGYGTKDQRLDFFSRLAYSRLLSRFKRAGLSRDHRFLDYGCGSGNLVSYLRSRGYQRAVGYDPYGDPEGAGNPAILERRAFDFICLQDVVEHVEDARELLRCLADLLRPGGRLLVGTPSADEIDLPSTHKHLHQLHVPYHLHLYTRAMLVEMGRQVGLEPARFYRRFYMETPLFGMNEAFCRRYLERFDDTIDALIEPVRLGVILRSPVLLFHGTFGYFYSPRHSVTVVFRKQP